MNDFGHPAISFEISAQFLLIPLSDQRLNDGLFGKRTEVHFAQRQVNRLVRARLFAEYAGRFSLDQMKLLMTRGGCLAVLIVSVLKVSSQTFTGTNPSGTFQDFAFNIGGAATNLAITIPGSTNGFSHLLLKKGAAPSDTSYDFIAVANNQTNAINLEIPEFSVTNYVLRVRTPTNSPTHSFTVNVSTNVSV